MALKEKSPTKWKSEPVLPEGEEFFRKLELKELAQCRCGDCEYCKSLLEEIASLRRHIALRDKVIKAHEARAKRPAANS